MGDEREAVAGSKAELRGCEEPIHVSVGPAILGIGTANPQYAVSQDTFVKFIMEGLHIPPTCDIARNLQQLGTRTAIDTRYFVSNDANKNRQDWIDLPKDFPETVPGMSYRNELYMKNAPKLAVEACRKAVDDWGGNNDDITHVIAVSCTGVMAPGIEFHIMNELKLKRTVQRLGINLMGCFGAFRGIATAKALAKENPKNRIIVVCVEICSIHFQAEMTLETFIGNALFADGAAAIVVGDKPSRREHTLWELAESASLIVENTTEDMTWQASDKGFVMKLSQKIPESIKKAVPDFVTYLIDGRCETEDCGWAIHPGGSAIIKGIEDVLKLQKWQTECSWDILRDYGNMSSVTFLFILNYLKQKGAKPSEQKECPWTVGLGFGPGLALEGVLLKSIS